MATEKKLRQLSALAGKLAAELFTNGSGEKAQRLVLTIDTPTPRNLGGWNESAAMNLIYGVLIKQSAK